MRTYLNIFCLLFLLFSCQERSSDELTVIDVKNGKSAEILLSEYFSSVEYIPLESKKETILSPSARFFVSEKEIIVIDKEILLFDKKTGEFKGTVSRQGQGPEEYSMLFRASYYDISNSVLASKGNQWIEINCETGQTKLVKKPDLSDMMRFSANDEKSAEFSMFMDPLMYSTKLNDDLYIGYVNNADGKNPMKLVYFDATGKIQLVIPNYLTFEGNDATMIFYAPIFDVSEDRTLFKEACNDTVFVLAEDKIMPVYLFDMGGKGLAYSEQDNEEKMANAMMIKMMYESANYLFFQYDYLTNKFVGVMDKSTGQVRLAKDGFANDLHDFLPLLPQYQNMQGEVISVIPAEKIIEFQENTNKGKHSALAHLENVQEDDNPVIAILIPR
jgi:hypothetical protein